MAIKIKFLEANEAHFFVRANANYIIVQPNEVAEFDDETANELIATGRFAKADSSDETPKAKAEAEAPKKEKKAKK